MKLPRSLRILVAMAVLVLGLGALLLVLTISEATLNIQARLDAAPWWLHYAWWGLIGAMSLIVTWVVWRLLRRAPDPDTTSERPSSPPDEQQIAAAMAQAEGLGADTERARQELAELSRRREAGEIHIALFGEISTGKSALIRALLPDADVVSDVRGGTTRALTRYQWTSPGGDALTVTDMPGNADGQESFDRMAGDEAKRAHIVVYVTDGDLNRAQLTDLETLALLNKPLIVTLNKTDRYSVQERAMLTERLNSLVAQHANTQVVGVSAGGQTERVRILPDGTEITETREQPPDIEALASAIQRLVDDDPTLLDALRDSATFVLTSQHLDDAIAAAREARALKLVDVYSAKAAVGALAAITPGSDLLIQGYLGTQMIKELAALYDTKPGKVDTELLLKLVQQHVGKAHTLLLAVAGNALKAFPGVGTLAGGAMHAVAYGIIFRTLGRALTTTLTTRGELHPRQTARLFEEKLSERVETSARDIARLVVEQARGDRSG